ncbi:MAG: hypothetical protein Q9208_001050 [Pyrenodesmia sp. 3 TL-2023]
MGCCHSTASGSSTTSPYLPTHAAATNPSGTSSLAAIATHRATSPNASSQMPNRSHRTLSPSEHFNAPLRPHIPSAKTKSSKNPKNRPRTWTRPLLEKERREFFETRVTGRSEVWGSLKLAVELLREGDVEDAQGVLDASGVTVPTGDMVDGCYDEQGALYQMPAWVVAEPEKVVENDCKGHLQGEGLLGDDEALQDEDGEGETEKGKEIEGVTVKARLSDRGGPDVVLVVRRDERVGGLVRRIQKEACVSVLVPVERLEKDTR